MRDFDIYNKKTRIAFTLVELLVVIAIIALLMSILMPALSLAKSQSKEAICQSNIRQLVLANIGYAVENDGHYVPASSDFLVNSEGGFHRWHGVRENENEPFDPLKGPLAMYLADGRVKECPGRPKLKKGLSWGESFEKGCGGYGYNQRYIGSRLWQLGRGEQAYSQTARITEVMSPAKTLMFADCAMAQKDRNDNSYLHEYSFAEPVFNGWGIASPSIHFRHRKEANVGWVDGHVDRQEMTSYGGKNAYGVKSVDVMLGWFEPLGNTPFDLK